MREQAIWTIGLYLVDSGHHDNGYVNWCIILIEQHYVSQRTDDMILPSAIQMELSLSSLKPILPFQTTVLIVSSSQI